MTGATTLGQYPDDISSSLAQAFEVLHRSLADTMVGVYLFGSAVKGGLRPNSDIDILSAVSRPVTGARREGLVDELMEISGARAARGPSRPLEVTVVVVEDVVPWRYPPRSDLVFGEWLRADFEANRIPPPTFDPDLTILLATVRQDSVALLGPAAQEVFDPIPTGDLRRAIVDSVPRLVRELHGDERNVLLTLARMWVTLATGEIVPKDVAAQWVLSRLPREHRAVLDLARSGYAGERDDNWTDRAEEVAAFVRYATETVAELGSSL